MQTTSHQTSDIAPWQLDEQAIQQVRTWLLRAANMKPDASAQQLAGVLKDPNGLGFTVGFVDRVIRPEDNIAAAHALANIAEHVPGFLPWYLQTAVKIGGRLARFAPNAIVPTAQAALRSLVGHLVIDARDPHLGKAIQRLRTEVYDSISTCSGRPFWGRMRPKIVWQPRWLIQRHDVDYVSIKSLPQWHRTITGLITKPLTTSLSSCDRFTVQQ